MDYEFLPFEQPIAELDQHIAELRQTKSSVNVQGEIQQLTEKRNALTESIFKNLTAHQHVLLARHPNRPHVKDLIPYIFTDFQELHGDRHYADDCAILGGMARFEGRPVMVIGHQKGRETDEKVKHNFGMPRPEGYRKALRLMQLAEKFSMPIITFIDTPGAYPGIGAEERNQSEAIAKNIQVMSRLKTPIICIVLGEGGSGGALAIGAGDQVWMMQYSVYSVISPEGCAAILWKDAKYAADAAESLRLTAPELLKQKLIDGIIEEPRGGAHRNLEETAANIHAVIKAQLGPLSGCAMDTLLERRYQKMMLENH